MSFTDELRKKALTSAKKSVILLNKKKYTKYQKYDLGGKTMKLLKLLSLLLCFVMLCSVLLVGCNGGGNQTGGGETGGETGGGTTSANPAVVALAGDYALNGADYGMPLTWYIRLTADEKFQISTKRDFSVDKGNGQVTENNGTFVFVYSDSTNENPKMATFTVANGNLVFSTNVPIGSATIASDDENNPVKALTLKNEAVCGEYVGSYTKTAMGSAVTYNYSLVLKAGNGYEFLSTFTMGGTPYSFIEIGTFSLENGVFTMTPDKQTNMAGEYLDASDKTPVVGSLADGQITVAVKGSAMASSRTETTLDFAVTSAYAGEYSAKKVTMAMGGMTVTATLTLDKVGRYTYSCTIASAMANSAYAEKGTFAVVDGAITLTPTHVMGETDYEEVTNPTPVTGALANYVLTASMPTGGMPTALTFYHDSMQGTFTASNAESKEETDPLYEVTLNLLADGSYTLTVKKDGEDSTSLSGTFTIAVTMGVQLQLTHDEGTLIGMVADGAINLQNVPVDTVGTELSFGLEK